MNTGIYLKSFVFDATSFEEYQNGLCTNKGVCCVTIIGKVFSHECIGLLLQGELPIPINVKFGLPIFGMTHGDVLEDRVQYGRIPNSFSWHDSNEPVVCEIFDNTTCIRFAMMSPLRIVEFHGKFIDVQ